MSIWKRAFTSIIRKRGQSMALLLLLSAILSAVGAVSVVQKAVELMKPQNAPAGSLLAATQSMEQLVNILMTVIFIVGFGVLSLILVFWIQSRIHETGILLSIGISKGKIIGQYLLEILMIAAVSFMIASFSGRGASQGLGKWMVMQTRDSVYDYKESPEEEAQRAFEETMKELSGTEGYVRLYGLGTLIIFLSVGISSTAIIRMKPKEILSKMS